MYARMDCICVCTRVTYVMFFSMLCTLCNVCEYVMYVMYLCHGRIDVCMQVVYARM